MTVLHTEAVGWIGRDVRILSGEEELTRLHISGFRKKGSFEMDGASFSIEPQGFFGANAVLKKGTATLARVEKTSLFRRRFKISSAGYSLFLESRSLFGKEYVLLVGGQEVGSVRRRGMTGRRMSLDFPDEFPLFMIILLAYLVESQARREAATSAAGG